MIRKLVGILPLTHVTVNMDFATVAVEDIVFVVLLGYTLSTLVERLDCVLQAVSVVTNFTSKPTLDHQFLSLPFSSY